MSQDRRRQRLRFDDLRQDTTPDGRCRVEVRLEWCDLSHRGTAEGVATHEGRLRAAALAALGATVSAGEGGVELGLSGIKAVRAFDGWVVVVAIRGKVDEQRYRLLGCAAIETEDALPRGAVLAVLDATNRVMEPFVPC